MRRAEDAARPPADRAPACAQASLTQQKPRSAAGGHLWARARAGMSYRKQSALDLAKLVDKKVMVKLQGGREVRGTRCHGQGQGARSAVCGQGRGRGTQGGAGCARALEVAKSCSRASLSCPLRCA